MDSARDRAHERIGFRAWRGRRHEDTPPLYGERVAAKALKRCTSTATSFPQTCCVRKKILEPFSQRLSARLRAYPTIYTMSDQFREGAAGEYDGRQPGMLGLDIDHA